MALRKQVVPVVFKEGLDAGETNPHHVQGAFLKVENGVMNRAGHIQKRTGLTDLTGTITDKYLATFKDRCVVYGSELAVHNGSGASLGGFDTVGDLQLCDIDVKPKDAEAQEKYRNVDVAIAGSVVAVMSYDNTSVATKIKTYDRYSGVQLDSLEPNDDTNVPGALLVVNGNIIYAYVTSTPTIKAGSISSAGVIGTASVVSTGGTATAPKASGIGSISACAVENGGTPKGVLAYVDTNDDPAIIVLSDDGTYHADYQETGATLCKQVGVLPWDTDDEYMVVYGDTVAPNHLVKAFIADASGASVSASVTVDSWATTADDEVISLTGVVYTSSEDALLLWERPDAQGADDHVLYVAKVSNSGSTISVDVAAAVAGYRLKLSSHAWADGGNGYALATYNQMGGTDEETAYLLRVTPAAAVTLVGQAAPGRGYVEDESTGMSGIISLGSSQYAVAIPYRTDENSVGVAIATVDLDPTPNAVDQGDYLIFHNSLPMQFDGNALTEVGFPIYPGGPSAVASGSGSGWLSVAGSYLYAITYEATDSNGNRVQSAPGFTDAVSVELTHDEVTITYPTLPLSHKSNVKVVLWKSAPNQSILYRISEQDNDATVGEDTFTDAGVDALANEQLYTTGNVLENISPPQCYCGTVYQSRHFVVDREQADRLLRYSKPFVRGRGIEHNDVLTLEVNSDGGDITALAVLADRLVIFKEDRIYVAQGSGLSNAGLGRGYATPFLVSEAIGCIDNRTVVLTPLGLMFLSNRGIYLLDQSFKLEPVGRRVRYHTDTYTLTGAAIVPERSIVLFTTESGPALVYNYEWKFWSTFTNHDADSITVAQGIYYYKDASTITAEDRSVWTDGGADVVLTLETGHVRLGGLLGFARLFRVLVLGYLRSACTLELAFQLNNDPYWQTAVELASSSLSDKTFEWSDFIRDGLDSTYEDKALILEAHPPRQKVDSIRIKINDKSLSGTGEGFSFSGLALYAGLKRGPFRPGIARLAQ